MMKLIGLEEGVVRIEPYTSMWAELYAVEAARIQAAIGNFILDLQHVGSTSIPGMVAKPILDLTAAVKQFEAASVCIAPLEGLGYRYLGENGIPRRHFFIKGKPRTHHLHINEIHSRDWENQVLFRDYLCAHPAVAREYAALKMALAHLHPHDRDAYLYGKAPYIQRILAMARHWRADFS